MFQSFLLQLFFRLGSVFLVGLASDHDPPAYASHVARFTGSYHHTWIIGYDEVLLTFCVEIAVLLISASRVAGIIVSPGQKFNTVHMIFKSFIKGSRMYT
jgi:hypothetical protein